MTATPRLGATRQAGGDVQFAVWAPFHERIALHLFDPDDRVVEMRRHDHGEHVAVVDDVPDGARYRYRLADGRELADPASRHQPEGVAGPSAVVSPDVGWSDGGWTGIEVDDLVLYELHVGTFTEEGTFEAAAEHAERLARLGVTAVELLPVAEFPGERNWGYDGVFPWAAQHSYGGPHGLRTFVDACHRAGLGVVLDVVYNHLGPEGNVLAEYGPYFTEAYRTPWGAALNFDGPGCDEVRRFFVESALMWVTECHVDGLRLDAVHAIVDPSPAPFVEELTAAVHARASQLGRRVLVTAEDAHNDPRLTRARNLGGIGMDAQWNDDYHHAVHVALTGERDGYYEDFTGVDDVVACLAHGFANSGRHSPSRGHRVGRPVHWPGGAPSRERLVAFTQNHDQVGNRAAGDRLSTLVDADRLRLAAGLLVLSPFVPLLFMGEEYGETAPFQYFVHHSDPGLVEAVRNGRRGEFAAFGWDPDAVPDPQDAATFARSRLDHSLTEIEPHRSLNALTAELIALRRELRVRSDVSSGLADPVEVSQTGAVVILRRPAAAVPSVTLFNAGATDAEAVMPAGSWARRLDSDEQRWGGTGAVVVDGVKSGGAETVGLPPWSFAVYTAAGW